MAETQLHDYRKKEREAGICMSMWTEQNGVRLSISETPDRKHMVVSLFEDGHVLSISLPAAVWDALLECRYRLEVKRNDPDDLPF